MLPWSEEGSSPVLDVVGDQGKSVTLSFPQKPREEMAAMCNGHAARRSICLSLLSMELC